MTLEQLINVDITDKNLLIIGSATVGKTHIASLIYKLNPNHLLISTDKFIFLGNDMATCEILKFIEKNKNRKVIVEGVKGYELLRLGNREDTFRPDIVIELSNSIESMTRINKQRKGGEIKWIERMSRGHQTILSQYFAGTTENQRPQWIKYFNNN